MAGGLGQGRVAVLNFGRGDVLAPSPFLGAGSDGRSAAERARSERPGNVVSVTNLPDNVVGNRMLMRLMGVWEIALSTSIVHLISCVMTFALMHSTLMKLKRASA
ncbi:hypothetical protein BH23GEM6_BH23GEM6_22570 [soil metagenome]